MTTPAPPADPAADPQYFTADDVAAQIEAARREAIEQARKEERDKLYKQLDKGDDRFKEMQAEVKRLQDAEAARAKEADKAAKAAEAAKQKAAEAELSAKDLLDKRNAEWEQKLAEAQAAQEARIEELRQQQETQAAIFAKEQEMAQLAIYTRDRVAAEQDNIAPELIDLIGGNTKEEVDASVEVMKAKTAAIVEGMRQAAVAQRAGMPGVASSGGATAITPGLDTGQQQLTPEDIKGMSMPEYAALRQKLNLAQAGSGRGIFG